MRKIQKKMKKQTFNFTQFYTLRGDTIDISPKFLQWLIGFFEGDGHFDKKIFSITQSSSNLETLDLIQTTLGLGNVYLHNTYTIQDGSERSTHRFSTYADPFSAAQVALLFNGHLITDTKLTAFQTWFTEWENNSEFMSLIGPNFILQDTPNLDLLSLDNGWLSGFIDADGCWNITLYKTPSKKNPVGQCRLAVACQIDHVWADNAIRFLKMGRKKNKNSNINQ